MGDRPFSQAMRAWTMKTSIPTAAQASTVANSETCGSWSSTPIRHLTVAGMETASLIAAIQSATSPGSRIRHAPKRPDWTRSEGQPTFRLISS